MKTAPAPANARAAGAHTPLERGDVHVFFATVPPAAGIPDRLHRVLSAPERRRAERFARRVHRDRFAASRAIRRLVLAQYLGVEPTEIEFVAGPHGKPAIAGNTRVRFNDSESDGLATYAVALDSEVGVDVERIGRCRDRDRIVEMFGTAAERRSYDSIPAAERELAFYRWWTGKEAYLKAVGTGLHQPLDSYSVSFGGARVTLVDVGGDRAAAVPWRLRALDTPGGWVGTLAIAEPEARVDESWWPGEQEMR